MIHSPPPNKPDLFDGLLASLEAQAFTGTGETIPDIISWGEQFIILPTGKHIQFEPHQKAILNHVFTFNKQGKLPYSIIIYSAPKKSGKTAINALVMTYWAFNIEAPNEIICVANKRDQAIARGFNELKGYIDRNPALGNETVTSTNREVVLSNGTSILAIPNDFAGEAGSNHGLTTWDEIWGLCVSDDTEIYTKKGWKNHEDLQISEEVATWSEGCYEWQPLEGVKRFFHDGELIKLNHRRADMLMTPNHRVLGRFRTSGHYILRDQPLEVRRADNAMKAYEGEVPVKCVWHGVEKPYYIPECKTKLPGWKEEYRIRPKRKVDMALWVEFLGYYISEGNITYTQKGGPPCNAFIGQCKSVHSDIYENIRRCVHALGFKYSCKETGIAILDSQVAYHLAKYGKCDEKYFDDDIKDMPAWILQILLKAYLDGDGWEAGKGYQCETVSKQLVDDLMEIGLKCGWIVKYMGSRKRSIRHRRIYRLSFTAGSICYHRRNWQLEKYKGIVWCPTVKNGMWLARRNGCVYWTGNSSERDQRLYDELTPVPTRKNSIRFISTYAGFSGESKLLEDIYHTIFTAEDDLKDGIDRPLGDDFPAYTKGELFMYWDHEPRMVWQTPSYYSSQRQNLRVNNYIRLHQNKWVSSESGLFDMDKWDACVDSEHAPPLPDKSIKLWVGVDASVKKDRSAVVSVYREDGKVMLGPKRFWQPTPEEPMDLEETMEAYLLDLHKGYTLLNVKYDPFQFHRSATTLIKKGLPMEELPQTGGNLTEITQNVYDLVKYGNIVLYECKDMRYEATCSIAKEKMRGLQIMKDKSTQKIDQIVALAEAALDAAAEEGGAIPEFSLERHTHGG